MEHCKLCNSTDVDTLYWANPNTGEIKNRADDMSENKGFCCDCLDYVDLEWREENDQS
jgi:hypothetical protein